MLALYADGTAHQRDDVGRDGHAQPRALYAADVLRPRKRLENVLLKRFAHADARIRDDERIIRESFRRARLLADREAHTAAFGRELDRVAQNVEQHPIKSQLVAEHVRVRGFRFLHREMQPLLRRRRLDDGLQFRNHLRQVQRLRLDFDFAAFNAAHIQHVVNQHQQTAARDGNLFQIVPNARRVVDMGFRQRGEAENRVHRRADVVAHAAQKRGLGVVGTLGLPQDRVQLLLALFQLAVEPPNLFHPRVHVGAVYARDFHVRHVYAQQQARTREKHRIALVRRVDGIGGLKMADDQQIRNFG